MITNQIRIIGIIIMTLSVVAPDATFADWKVYYTGKAAGMFGSGGRGDFSTQSQCEAYRSSSAGFERNNSYCSGFDTPSYKPATPSHPSLDDGSAEREQEKERQLDLQNEQKERELEIARQKKFAEEKEQLLGSFKGTRTGSLGLKTGTGSVAGCIEKNRECVLNGTSCCAPYSCSGKFPNTYCGTIKGTDTGTLGLKTGKGSVDPNILQEQKEFEKMNAEWIKKQKQLVEQRLREPNKYASALYKSLKINDIG